MSIASLNEGSGIVGVGLSSGIIVNIRWYVFIAVVILLISGNSLTVCAVATTDKLRIKIYALMTSMAVADICVGLVMANYVIHQMLSRTPCDLATNKSAVRPIERMVYYSSYMHVAAIAIDRYVAVVYPLRYDVIMTSVKIRRLIVAVWFTAMCISVPPYLSFAGIGVGASSSCIITLWPLFETVLELGMYVIDSTIVIIVNSKLWSTAVKSEQQVLQLQLHEQRQFGRKTQTRTDEDASMTSIMTRVTANPASATNNTAQNQSIKESSSPHSLADNGVVSSVPIQASGSGVEPSGPSASTSTGDGGQRTGPGCPAWWHKSKLLSQHRATRTVMVLITFHVVMWFPYFLSRLIGAVGQTPNLANILQSVGSIIGSFSFSINIFIFAGVNRNFRLAFKRMLLPQSRNTVHPTKSSAVSGN
jgi:hypothetical protein